MSEEHKTEENIPIFGIQINEGIDTPFADLYLDMFPEYYDIE